LDGDDGEFWEWIPARCTGWRAALSDPMTHKPPHPATPPPPVGVDMPEWGNFAANVPLGWNGSWEGNGGWGPQDDWV
jgi:hypothetical protein